MNREQSNATVNDVSLSGPVFNKLLMQLYTHDQKMALQGQLKRNITDGKTLK